MHKLSIDTNIQLSMTGAICCTLAKNPGQFDPFEFFKDAALKFARLGFSRLVVPR